MTPPNANVFVLCEQEARDRGCAPVRPNRAGTRPSRGFTDPSRDLVDAAKRYIEVQYHHTISLAEVADHVHCNASYLSYLFKVVTGVNFVQYLTQCRVEKAKELLQDPQLKVYQVAQMVGYPNPRYFSEIFKRYTHSSPAEYRAIVAM